MQVPIDSILHDYHKINCETDLKKLYEQFSIPQLISEHGISEEQLIPTIIDQKSCFNVKTTKQNNFTPLWYYDNTEFDCRNADEWLQRGFFEGVQRPVPATVYLPTDPDGPCNNYSWTNANVIEYSETLQTYTVVLENNSNKIYTNVPRIQIHFKGEDPRVFVKRIKDAVARRNQREQMIL